MHRNLWQCNKTIQEMLAARGYCEKNDDQQIDHQTVLKTYELFEEQIKEFISECGNSQKGTITQKVLEKLTFLRQHEFTGEYIYVFFVIGKIGVNLINVYVSSMTESQVSRAILVSVPNVGNLGEQSVLTPFAVKEIIKYKQEEHKIIEHFYFSDITKNILDNELQPKHIKILTKDEKMEILKEIMQSSSQDSSKVPPLLRILPGDPLARFLGLQNGDVIECLCNSKSAGEAIRYRLCYQ